MLTAACGLTTNVTVDVGGGDGGSGNATAGDGSAGGSSGGSGGGSSGGSSGGSGGSSGGSGSGSGGGADASAARVDAGREDGSDGTEDASREPDAASVADSGATTDDATADDDATPEEDATSGGHPDASAGKPDGAAPVDSGAGTDAGDAGAVTVVGPGSASCGTATPIPLNSPQYTALLAADTTGSGSAVAPPCAGGGAIGGEVFFKLSFSKPVVLYADTFGATSDAVLFLLSNQCLPLTGSTTPGDALCNAGACNTTQSQIVALLEAGNYKLGVATSGSAQGAVDVHLQWALAPGGTLAQLPQGASVQTGKTSGAGNIEGLNASCISAGPENGYWWTSCPTDTGGALSASTCGGTTWQSVLEVQIPGSIPYACNLDSCGLQTVLDTNVPAGAGLRVLSVDGESGSDEGPYSLTVSRP